MFVIGSSFNRTILSSDVNTFRVNQTDRACFRKLTDHPRLAGTKFNRDAGYYVHQEFLKYGLASEISEYNVTLSYPEDIKDNYVCNLNHMSTAEVMLKVNATFNNISAIPWWSVFLMEETGVPGENHRPAASHWLYSN